MNGFKFLGKHTHKDYGLTLAPGSVIGSPKKKKITVAIPFSNHVYDFSEIYGDQVYEERPLTYKLNVAAKSIVGMHQKKVVLTNWLMNSHGKQKLYDDRYPGYYFLAEVIDDADINIDSTNGVFSVTFNAYPFMIAELPEGNDIWDSFNFELDISQNLSFIVEGELEVEIINAGTPQVIPTIDASADMSINKGNTTYDVKSGKTKNLDFTLDSGVNTITIIGNGTIKFEFYKELI